jgi:hypothetical protein
MRLSVERVKTMCRERGESVSAMLESARVSRNAFYTLARRESLFPRTLEAIGERLGVRPDSLLTDDDRKTEGMKALLAETDAIARRYPGVDRENVRHALLLLREKPIDRMRRALVRGKSAHIHR